MKTAKKLVAIICSIAMFLSIGAICASAYDVGDGIAWHDESDNSTMLYIYGGKFTEGTNTPDSEFLIENLSVAYEFDAAESGYYQITCENSWVNLPDTYEDGEAANFNQSIYYMEKETDADAELFYIEEGTTLIAVEWIDPEVTVDIKYVGRIEDVAFEPGFLENLILNENVYYSEEDNIYSLFNCDHTITTDKGFEFYQTYFVELKGMSEFGPGENTVLFEIPFFEKELTITIYEITDYIKDIKVENIDAHLQVTAHYNGLIEANHLGFEEEKVTITYVDNTKETITIKPEDAYDTYPVITLPNGAECHLANYFSEENGEYDFIVEVAGKVFVQEKCETEKAPISKGFELMQERINEVIEEIKYEIGWAIENGEIPYIFEMIFGNYYINEITSAISEFFGFYF